MIKVNTPSGVWQPFCDRIARFLDADIIRMQIDGKDVQGYRSPDSPALWIRDHSDMLRGGKYFHEDVRSAVEIFAEMQSARGRLFDYVLPTALRGSSERENWEKWVRVPVEADVEYRFVLAVREAWQASSDDNWLTKILPAAEKALAYSLSHPLRFDKETGLVKRPYTIDTWDFDYTAGRHDWLNFQITDHTFWGIQHGDVSGVYAACQFLADANAHFGNHEASAAWLEHGLALRERANALLFNGRFYTHFHKLTPVDVPGVDETEQLSLSSPMAINRGLATPEIARAIIKEYQQRRASRDSFAEWFGIDPPFPTGAFGDDKLIAGAYINGGVFPLCGGELARAALENGFENYGVQTLQQYRKMIEEKGETYLWYFPNGEPSSVESSTSPDALPTDGWGSTAMLYGFIEGLCGVQDLASGFSRLQIVPRWLFAGEAHAEINLEYASSGKQFGYTYQHDPANKRIRLELQGPAASQAHVALPLPHETTIRRFRIDGADVKHSLKSVGESNYATAEASCSANSKISVEYA